MTVADRVATCERVADTLAAAYRERVGTEPDVYPCVPSPGAYAPSVSST